LANSLNEYLRLKDETMSLILSDFKNGALILKFNRPEVFNSFNQPMAYELHEKLDEAKTRNDVRAVMLIGEGKAFCAGQDLAEVMDPEGPELTHIVTKHYNPIIERIRKLDKPVIAAVNGVAAGAGANIALACDIVIASEKAKFIQAFSKIGLIPDSAGTFFLPRLVGFQKASALAMTGDAVTAEEAEKMGMLYKVYSAEDFETNCIQFSEKMAAMPTKGLAYTKALFNESYNNNLTEQLAMEGDYQTRASETEDYEEGVNAFLEKRQATFKGK
jgi:2-(1,2-epoxy-1,2-dihydrophenyl)acetyl-CoA isomerase